MNGNRVGHGQQGEVVGPALSASNKGMAVLFPGSNAAANCFLTNVRHRHYRNPTAPAFQTHTLA